MCQTYLVVRACWLITLFLPCLLQVHHGRQLHSLRNTNKNGVLTSDSNPVFVQNQIYVWLNTSPVWHFLLIPIQLCQIFVFFFTVVLRRFTLKTSSSQASAAVRRWVGSTWSPWSINKIDFGLFERWNGNFCLFFVVLFLGIFGSANRNRSTARSELLASKHLRCVNKNLPKHEIGTNNSSICDEKWTIFSNKTPKEWWTQEKRVRCTCPATLPTASASFLQLLVLRHLRREENNGCWIKGKKLQNWNPEIWKFFINLSNSFFGLFVGFSWIVPRPVRFMAAPTTVVAPIKRLSWAFACSSAVFLLSSVGSFKVPVVWDHGSC